MQINSITRNNSFLLVKIQRLDGTFCGKAVEKETLIHCYLEVNGNCVPLDGNLTISIKIKQAFYSVTQ